MHGGGAALADLRQRFDVYALTAVLAMAAMMLYAGLIEPHAAPPVSPVIPWWVLAALYAMAETFVVHMAVGRETHTFSLNEVPLVLGLFLAAPGDLLFAQVVGAALALTLHRHQAARKFMFNLASFAFSTTIAICAFIVIADPTDRFGPRGWIAAFAAALVADFVSAVTVQLAIAFSTGEKPDWSTLRSPGALYVLANATLGLVAVMLITTRPETVWLAAALTIVLYAAYRVSERERQKHQRLMGLHDATRAVQEALQGQVVTRRLLEQARSIFGAELAELLMLPVDHKPARRTRVLRDGTIEDEPSAHLDPTEGVWARVAAEGIGVRLTTARAPDRLRSHLSIAGVRDLMAAPVHGGRGVIAVLLVMNREGHVGGWRDEDMTLLETLANHAGIALRNGELLDGLATRAAESEYQALHDALTGLPNRTWFQRLADEAIHGGAPAAVLTLDVDRFKEINDALGHENGDRILRDVAARLTESAPDGDIVARLSGDTFAMLVGFGPVTDDPGSVADGGGATAAARSAVERVQRLLERSFALGELSLNVNVSIGVALVGTDGDDAGTLLRHADIAMHLAKEARTGVEFYASNRDVYSPARLALAGEFRHAVDAGELEAWFQPKVELSTGRIVGAEALARWLHPVRGLVMPDAFIPIVEQTSLLQPLTTFMLRSSIRACAGWRAAGLDLSIAVNLSARNLHDDALGGDVAGLLGEFGLPAPALTLEITESAMMADPARAEATLGQLEQLGVRISIDDFGTGHASLAYLKRLPVTELKVDRSFVMGLDVDKDDRSIVRSTIELAHELGLSTVAEGVETTWIWDWLAAQGCDLAQGRLMGMAVPGDEFEDLVRRSAPDARAPGRLAPALTRRQLQPRRERHAPRLPGRPASRIA